MTDGVRRAWQRMVAFFRGREMDADLSEEMAAHLEMAAEENARKGMTKEEARRTALVEFGGVEQAREHHRDSRSLPMLEVLRQDIRYTMRSLRRERGFTLVAIAILALGIGANIAVFSVVNTLLLRPLPFPDAGRLTWVANNWGTEGLSLTTYNVATYEEYAKHNQSFEELTTFMPFWGDSEYNMTGHGEAQHLLGVMVSENFFHTLGVKPELGRTFLPEECAKGGQPAAVLTHGFWQREFQGDPGIIGKGVSLNGKEVTIVGVLPADFDFASVFWPGLKPDIFVPGVMDVLRTWGNTISVFGKLKPGVSVQQAQAEADVVLPQIKAANKEVYDFQTITLLPLKEYVSGKLRRSLIVLWCAVGLILLIVCVNLSNLLLARLTSRGKEFALRTALGASRGRLIRQLLTESLALSFAGAVLGTGLAWGVTGYLAQQGSIGLPLMSRIGIDGTVLGWTLLITLLVGVLFGIAPGLAVSRGNVQETLKEAGRGTSEGKGQDRLRALMVVSEVALACVLMVGAGLLLRSFLRVMDVDLGFQPSRGAALEVVYRGGDTPKGRMAAMKEMIRQVKEIPGVESAGIVDMMPLDRNRSWGLEPQGQVFPKGADLSAIVRIATPGYLGAMGIRLKEGRDFEWEDTDDKEPVVIINESAAKKYWPKESAVGKLAYCTGKVPAKVIGVVEDVRVSSMEIAPGVEMYLPPSEGDPEGAHLVVRSALPLNVLQSSVMTTLRRLEPDQPATRFQPLEGLVDRSVSPRKFFVRLVGIFAGLGVVLAALGIYGVISYSVARRTPEIGIRMALGATAGRVQRDVIWYTLKQALLGIALGTVASLLVARGIASMLFQTEPSDPISFAAMVLLLGGVAFAAGYFPARRASRIQPMEALRVE